MNIMDNEYMKVDINRVEVECTDCGDFMCERCVENLPSGDATFHANGSYYAGSGYIYNPASNSNNWTV